MSRFWFVGLITAVFALPALAQNDESEEEPAATPTPVVEEEAPAATPTPVVEEQEATPTPTPVKEEPPARKQEEVIRVTGSRLQTDPTDKPASVITLDAEELAKSGLTSAADILQRLPVSGGALNTKFNSSGNFGFPPDGGGIGAGAAQVDMRHLGSKRVLVLVDGVRWVDGSSGSGVPSATDLNTIPLGIIDRIEVLSDGASPIYGSDAIGGVVNIITKRDLKSTVVANAYVGGYDQLDGGTQQYDLTWGNNSGKMSTLFSVSYVEQGMVSASDRDISQFPVPGVGECTPNCSSGTPMGRFYFTDPNTGDTHDLTLAQQPGSGKPYYDAANPGGGGDDFKPFETTDRFNFAPYNLVLTPSQRFGVMSRVDYDIAPQVKMKAKAFFNNRKSQNRAAPEPLFIGPEAGNGNRMDTISVDATNPYNPFGFTLDAETNPYFIGRRPVEAGPRLFKQNVNTMYVSGGFDGNFPMGNALNVMWDATATYGVNRADQIKTGAFNSAKLAKALGPVDECEADPECVPFNIFGGPGSITPEMLDYVTFVQKDVSEQQLFDLQANFTSDVLALPAGFLSVAVGLEHRQQMGFFQPDSIVVAGDSAGVPSSPTSGRFAVNEAYGELRLPILANAPAAHLLDVSGAVRVSSYDTFGTQPTYRVGARWRPARDLLLRGNWGQGFRAPGIGELFGSAARFDQTISDPCSDMLGLYGGTPAPQSVVDNCVAMGVPADGSYQQFNSQISVTTGGNPNLEPETSDQITASVVYSPRFLRKRSWSERIDFELTYWRIELDNAIQALDAQVQLDACANTGDPLLCAGISRTSGGVINGFDNQLTNIGGIRTQGLDLTLQYVSPATRLGTFRATSLTGVLGEFTEIIPSSAGFEEVSREGTEVGDPERAYARVKSNLVLDFVRPRWNASWSLRYVGSVTEPCRGLEGYGLCSDYNADDDSLSTNELDATLYNDVRVGYNPPILQDKLHLSLGVNNLFNQDPPNCYSCALNGFDATAYDVPGMFGYFRAGLEM